ncbi:MAG TPA: hypothetical protein VMA75_00440 [Candidatus Paceibacterota bacterium]|nr:hypothetical protein [Candidatus Paceibacterota bacterium]
MTSDRQAPTNTTEATKRNPAGFLLDALVVGSSNAIELQVSQGQRELVNSTTLPTQMGGCRDYDTKKILEAAGVKFGEVVEDDDLFQYVELPAGWKKVSTDHSMHSNLVDDKGRVRARIFYKAAFYDRRADLQSERRFGASVDYGRREKEGVAVANVTDCGKVIYSTEPVKLPDDDRKSYEASDKAQAAAFKWLDKHYPDWRNPGAYWD